jgi:meso-butanediol dehydrogenase/(S,S)-butanediol dehydrogenase/diacetyl reductase
LSAADAGGIERAIGGYFGRKSAYVFAADLTKSGSVSAEEVQGAMARVLQKFAEPDFLVNAFGIEIERTVEESSLADWNRICAAERDALARRPAG